MKNIYKAGLIALVATPLFGLFSQNTYAIMPSTFNDVNFYNCVVSEFSSQYPDEVIAQSGLTNEQLGKMSSLNCWRRYITNTTGLELMTSLTNLDLSENQLPSIDVSKNVNLTNLNLLSNQLTSIDLSKNVNLTDLSLSINQLTSIDVSKNVNLTGLSLTNNQLTSIDVSKNVNLTGLDLYNNQLTSIDVSKNVNLTDLDLYGNRLTSIDVSKNVNLTGLSLTNNQLTSIDLSKNVNLGMLFLKNNQLTSIDVSKNPRIELLNIDSIVVVETGVLPESDGNLSTYDFSEFQFFVGQYLKNPCDELDDSLSEECVFEWDRENRRLNVSSSLIGSEVEVSWRSESDNDGPFFSLNEWSKLRLTEPEPEEPEPEEPEPEEDNENVVVPNTGAPTKSSSVNAVFSIIGVLLVSIVALIKKATQKAKF